ncbi:LysM peptidoglycan-binding domain-containing protein [Facklamia sp. DSM 111018]|uniref:LysM peptidoglycan-binding domain-containing protein n=1 Tax=Facklamia lactis TaxID=2749967 RepID=A0ABS0LU64_9LACT|nr:LysM peptidoglycan-binding domain-containing protein [Facklamia lactis]MBG9986839.1 LysM peptidoglycan-binding domain-containing protein [Facklamia lactis]
MKKTLTMLLASTLFLPAVGSVIEVVAQDNTINTELSVNKQWRRRSLDEVLANVQEILSNAEEVYIIQWGDTLSTIAEATGIATSDLAQINQISNPDYIITGAEIRFNPVTHTITYSDDSMEEAEEYQAFATETLPEEETSVVEESEYLVEQAVDFSNSEETIGAEEGLVALDNTLSEVSVEVSEEESTEEVSLIAGELEEVVVETSEASEIETSQTSAEELMVEEITSVEESYVEETTEESYVEETTEESYVEETTEESYVEETTEESYVEEITEESYVEETTEESYVEETTEETYVEETTEETYVEETTEEPYVEETTEEAVVDAPVSYGDPYSAFEQISADKGLSQAEKDMWSSIIASESGWSHTVSNPSSGAYGLPQALPGSKMASHGADWATNPYTQLAWMYDYMVGRYGSISGAWSFWQGNRWY